MQEATRSDTGRSSGITLTQIDALQLEWFFGRGQIAFERSNFGAMLAHAEMYSVARFYQPAPRPVLDRDGEVIGYERGITARPTAETRPASGYEPDNNTLTRYAYVSAVLKRMSALHCQALECFYGDMGQRWAGHERFGRHGALFHLTVKGQKLIEAANRAKHALELRATDRIEVLCAVQLAQPTPERTQALSVCKMQALALIGNAHAQWNTLKRATREAKQARAS